MYCQASNIIWVRLERNDLLMRVVVEDAQLEVVRTGNKPVFTGNETHTAYGNLCDFKSLDERTGFEVVDVNIAVVETS